MNDSTMTSKDWAIQVEDKAAIMSETATAEEEQWKRQSIYNIHPYISDLNSKAFVPQVVSFGPYHHGKDHLKYMERHKERALLQFLKRSKNPFEVFMESLVCIEEDLKNSYDLLGDEWRQDSDKFLKMMILDGCFMVEIIRAATDEVRDYSLRDPIFSDHGGIYVVPIIKRDMMLLENQLPILLIDTLLAVEANKPEDLGMAKELIGKFFCLGSGRWKEGKFLHLLDIYRYSLVQEQRCEDEDIIHSATHLVESGVKFRKSKSLRLSDIKFKDGILSLPTITVDDTTESTFLNLMAYERLHVGAGNEVTSYVFFMKGILDRADDVAHLVGKGIIKNAYGSNKHVADLFNRLSKDITIDPNGELEKVQKTVNLYRKKHRHRWRASLVRTYFVNPWVIITALAAIWIFGFDSIASVYSVLSYYK
ncbi:PREDICTED: UPF0481 protein At3g47200-like [Tarenaya hassleriana]|uniref:UPF0481 protein At3g47200-like n=1 Tax=Tarenaya hassleriana TaxID=28532 RepID=UPI00053C1196|nr:PREDICTED: UPF0481 protein At3g47200-like [Tarenaya hassleriana]